jgi:rhodanese-related sulfurtransferase
LIKNTRYHLARLFLLFLFPLFSAAGASAHSTEDKELISPKDLASAAGIYQILDLRSREDFVASHVPGAFSLPLQELSESTLQAIGIVHENELVLYGASESSGKKGKLLLKVLGYEKVRILAGGFTHWLEDGGPIEQGAIEAAGQTISEGSGLGLAVIPASYDFGLISKKDGVVTTEFVIQNTSASEISIEEITTSCGCTSAEIEEKTIPAGESLILKVHFDPDFHKEPEGKFSRTVFLETSGNREIEVKIEVEILQ